MLARRLPGLLPEREDGTECPFRAPHHTAGVVSMLGGGRPPQPGEVTLADGGILFLDELPEFSGTILEALLSARTLSDGAVFGLFDGDQRRVEARPGGGVARPSALSKPLRGSFAALRPFG